jgi:hypothetical protein
MKKSVLVMSSNPILGRGGEWSCSTHTRPRYTSGVIWIKDGKRHDQEPAMNRVPYVTHPIIVAPMYHEQLYSKEACPRRRGCASSISRVGADVPVKAIPDDQSMDLAGPTGRQTESDDESRAKVLPGTVRPGLTDASGTDGQTPE